MIPRLYPLQVPSRGIPFFVISILFNKVIHSLVPYAERFGVREKSIESKYMFSVPGWEEDCLSNMPHESPDS